jgi:hypothetical protein
MTLNSFLEKLKQTQKITFTETIAVIEENYTFLQRHLKMEYCTMLLERTPFLLFSFAEIQNLSESNVVLFWRLLSRRRFRRS